MPSAPWLAPLLAAFVAGLLAGFSITLAMTNVIRRTRCHAQELRAKSVRWLAARIVLSRATISLVSAMRALKKPPENSEFSSLRLAEAQRARAAWFSARRELDRAAASLECWYYSHGERQPFVTDDPGIAALRQAIDGDDAAAAQLVQSLRAADEAARAAIQQSLMPDFSPCSRLVRSAVRLTLAPFGKVLQSWSQRS